MRNKIMSKISFIIALLLTVTGCVLLGLKTDVLNITKIREIFFVDISNFTAEKSEFFQYVFLVFGFFLIFLFTSYLLKNHLKDKKIKNEKKLNKVLNLVIIIIFIFLLFLAFYNLSDWYKIFFNHKRLVKYYFFPLYAFIIIKLLFIKKDSNKRIINIISIIACFLLIISIGLLYYSKYYDYSDNLIHHFNAYYYPILKVSSGLTIGIDFTSLYGMYPYIFTLLMKIFCLKGISGVGFITSIIAMLTLLNIFYFLNKNFKNKLICFLVLLSIITFTSIFDLFLSKSLYIQYFPHRVFGISMLLAYIAFYMKKERNIYYSIVGYLISVFALFYNFETGIVVLLTWLAFMAYKKLYKVQLFSKEFFKYILFQLFLTLMSIAVYFLIVLLITYIRSGVVIKISSLLFGQNVFFNHGFFMLKAPKYGMWIVFVFIALYSLSFSIKEIKDFRTKKPNYKYHSNIFIISIIFLGILSYYQGRSHDIVFLSVVYPILILLGLGLDNNVNNNKPILSILCSSLLIMLSFVTISHFINNSTINTVLFEKNQVDHNIFTKELENIQDIKTTITDLEFLISNESYYYNYYNMKDTKRISGYVDIFMYQQIKDVLDYLKENNKSIITDKVIFDPIKTRYKKQLKKIILKDYKIYKRQDYIIFINKNDWQYIKLLNNIEEITI